MNDFTAIYRLIDANANRAREALRVMEDAARFLIDDANLSSAIKNARHDLATALQTLGDLTPYRDTPGDVGTTLSTSGETQRTDAVAVAIAAGKRLSEALRAIEEYSKIPPHPTVSPAISSDFSSTTQMAARIESLRYRGYELEKQLTARLTRLRPRWRLCVLITEALCTHHAWFDVARLAVDAGADCIQLREKNMDSGELLSRATQLVEQLADRANIIINDRPDIAQMSGAHGVHLGQSDLPCREVRRAFPNLLVGISTSHLEQAKQAQRDGADYCGVGPMFPTTTKIKKHIVGPDYLRDYLQWNGLPALAIGGINSDNVAQLQPAQINPVGLAVTGAICGAKDIEKQIESLLAFSISNHESARDMVQNS